MCLYLASWPNDWYTMASREVRYSLAQQVGVVVLAYLLKTCQRVQVWRFARLPGLARLVVAVARYRAHPAFGACHIGNDPYIIQLIYVCCCCQYSMVSGCARCWGPLHRISVMLHCTVDEKHEKGVFFAVLLIISLVIWLVLDCLGADVDYVLAKDSSYGRWPRTVSNWKEALTYGPWSRANWGEGWISVQQISCHNTLLLAYKTERQYGSSISLWRGRPLPRYTRGWNQHATKIQE